MQNSELPDYVHLPCPNLEVSRRWFRNLHFCRTAYYFFVSSFPFTVRTYAKNQKICKEKENRRKFKAIPMLWEWLLE